MIKVKYEVLSIVTSIKPRERKKVGHTWATP